MRILLNSQRKQLHEILQRHEIDPAVTRWISEGKGWAAGNSFETLEAGLCHFLFMPGSDGDSSIHFKPSLDGGASHGLVGRSWSDVLELFDMWAINVKKELAQQDPWQQYSAYLPPERIGGLTDNSPFTHQEAEHAAKSVSLFLEHIKNQLPNYSQVANQFDPNLKG